MAERKARPKAKGQNFETTIKQLEKLVDTLESQDTSLEDSLAAFESGIGIIRAAEKALSEAEQRIQLLIEENGELVEQPADLDINMDGE